RRDPVAERRDPAPLRVGKTYDVATLGGEALARGEGETRVVTGEDAVIERHFHALDQIVTHEGIHDVVQGLRQQPAGEISVGLHLRGEERDLAHPEPAERVIDAHHPTPGKIHRVGHARHLAPAGGERCLPERAACSARAACSPTSPALNTCTRVWIGSRVSASSRASSCASSSTPREKYTE